MIASLIILAALVLVGGLLYLHECRARRLERDSASNDVVAAEPQEKANENEQEADEACCGMHITCEKDSLLASVSREVVYYDDEELDAYIGRGADQYTESETEQFRDVLLTLLPEDIAGWGRSLQLRGITLPEAVRDELIMIVAEARQAQVQRV